MFLLQRRISYVKSKPQLLFGSRAAHRFCDPHLKSTWEGDRKMNTMVTETLMVNQCIFNTRPESAKPNKIKQCYKTNIIAINFLIRLKAKI